MLLTVRNLTKSYGPRLLFNGITLAIEEGERIGLIGANGSGKSTLLRIFAGIEPPDDGEMISRKQLRVAYVAQEESFDPDQSCADIVADNIDHHFDDHERHIQADILLGKAGFVDGHILAGKLSGGWEKRLAIVRQLATNPDLILFDEPTNHLDVEGILWLEELIASAPFATLSVSHDRRFLESIGNRIIELGRAYPDGYLSHTGSYSDFLTKREDFLAAQLGREQSLASGVRREIEWLQRGAKARTTKAKGRIERAGEMMSDLADVKSRNAQTGSAQVEFIASDRKTRKLIELTNVTKSLGGKKLITDLSLTLAPSKRIGLLGPNGSGKSTLIRMLTGELQPDSGKIFRADQLQLVVFDQHRETLDPDQSLRRALSPMGDNLSFQGNNMHVSGWARRFLFRNEQLDLPVRELSGGEQARVLIARLMLKPADVLILDEPTNDLDIATLDVLENSLNSFPGALILVTHDRYLLDRVSTDILALDGRGKATVYADLAQWERAVIEAQQEETKKIVAKNSPKASVNLPTVKKKKLTWNEAKELEGMETSIMLAEQDIEKYQSEVNDPIVQANHEKMRIACENLGQAQTKADKLYTRWAELEAAQNENN